MPSGVASPRSVASRCEQRRVGRAREQRREQRIFLRARRDRRRRRRSAHCVRRRGRAAGLRVDAGRRLDREHALGGNARPVGHRRLRDADLARKLADAAGGADRFVEPGCPASLGSPRALVFLGTSAIRMADFNRERLCPHGIRVNSPRLYVRSLFRAVRRRARDGAARGRHLRLSHFALQHRRCAAACTSASLPRHVLAASVPAESAGNRWRLTRLRRPALAAIVLAGVAIDLRGARSPPAADVADSPARSRSWRRRRPTNGPKPGIAFGVVEVPGIFRQADEVADGRIGGPRAAKRRTRQIRRNAGPQKGADVGLRGDRFDRRQAGEDRTAASAAGGSASADGGEAQRGVRSPSTGAGSSRRSCASACARPALEEILRLAHACVSSRTAPRQRFRIGAVALALDERAARHGARRRRIGNRLPHRLRHRHRFDQIVAGLGARPRLRPDRRSPQQARRAARRRSAAAPPTATARRSRDCRDSWPFRCGAARSRRCRHRTSRGRRRRTAWSRAAFPARRPAPRPAAR